MIDSLRPDYVSSYNNAVSFTPAIQAFADDSFVFTRAFSRYGGTGLAVPSICAGAMVIHKQYVTPFAPMNALEKLIVAKGYRRFITEDHLTDELFSASPATVGLDHHVSEMMHTFCRTMGELEHHLKSLPDGPPLFVDHTAPGPAHRQYRQREAAAWGVLSRIPRPVRGARPPHRCLLWRVHRDAEARAAATTTASSSSPRIMAIRSAKISGGGTASPHFRRC